MREWCAVGMHAMRISTGVRMRVGEYMDISVNGVRANTWGEYMHTYA